MKLQCSFAKNPPLGNPTPPPRVDFCSFWDFPALQFLFFHSNCCSAFFEKLQCSLLETVAQSKLPWGPGPRLGAQTKGK